METLKTKNIGTGLYFCTACMQKYYREHFTTLSLPNTKWGSACIYPLPLLSGMTEAGIQQVIATLRKIARQ